MDMSTFLTKPLSLSKLELIEVDLPQHERFRSAVGYRYSREALFVRWVDSDGAWGIGESSCRPDPFFSHEFLNGARQVIEDHLFHLIPAAGTYGDLIAACKRIRGWQFAKAAVIEAVHDLWQRRGEQDPLDAWKPAALTEVPVGISLGLYDTSEQLVAKIGEGLDQGYHRIKLKIKPGLDSAYLRSAREAFPDAYLGCDANGSFDESNMDELKRLADFGLAMLEQPFAPDRLDLCAKLKREAPELQICLDEGVAAEGHLRAAIAMDAIDELNIKPGRVGGMLESIRLADIAGEYGLPVWIGGMFETGIGRASNLRFAARFGNAKAHDLSPSKRYFKQDVVAHPLDMNEDGKIALPTEPVSLDEAGLASVHVRTKELIKK